MHIVFKWPLKWNSPNSSKLNLRAQLKGSTVNINTLYKSVNRVIKLKNNLQKLDIISDWLILYQLWKDLGSNKREYGYREQLLVAIDSSSWCGVCTSSLTNLEVTNKYHGYLPCCWEKATLPHVHSSTILHGNRRGTPVSKQHPQTPYNTRPDIIWNWLDPDLASSWHNRTSKITITIEPTMTLVTELRHRNKEIKSIKRKEYTSMHLGGWIIME